MLTPSILENCCTFRLQDQAFRGNLPPWACDREELSSWVWTDQGQPRMHRKRVGQRKPRMHQRGCRE
eukprot:910799-Pyramimonas_sp.AAC.1